MKDRVSDNPNRVKLTPVGVGNGLYTMERADEPTEEGTKLNKESMLNDGAVAKVWPNPASRPPDPTVSQAIQQIAIQGGFLIGDILCSGQDPNTGRGTPGSWLLCDGSQVDSEKYGDLDNLIPTNDLSKNWSHSDLTLDGIQAVSYVSSNEYWVQCGVIYSADYKTADIVVFYAEKPWFPWTKRVLGKFDYGDQTDGSNIAIIQTPIIVFGEGSFVVSFSIVAMSSTRKTVYTHVHTYSTKDLGGEWQHKVINFQPYRDEAAYLLSLKYLIKGRFALVIQHKDTAYGASRPPIVTYLCLNDDPASGNEWTKRFFLSLNEDYKGLVNGQQAFDIAYIDDSFALLVVNWQELSYDNKKYSLYVYKCDLNFGIQNSFLIESAADKYYYYFVKLMSLNDRLFIIKEDSPTWVYATNSGYDSWILQQQFSGKSLDKLENLLRYDEGQYTLAFQDSSSSKVGFWWNTDFSKLLVDTSQYKELAISGYPSANTVQSNTNTYAVFGYFSNIYGVSYIEVEKHLPNILVDTSGKVKAWIKGLN